MCEGSGWDGPEASTILLGASSLCGTPMSSPLHPVSPFHALVPFSTVLPGGCPACDSHALQEALQCLERHYAGFPLPSGISFNGSYSFLEDAADTGGLAIALQVTHIPRARTYIYQQARQPVPSVSFLHP